MFLTLYNAHVQLLIVPVRMVTKSVWAILWPKITYTGLRTVLCRQRQVIMQTMHFSSAKSAHTGKTIRRGLSKTCLSFFVIDQVVIRQLPLPL